MTAITAVLWWTLLLAAPARPEVLTPPYFNLAEGRRITATATCGEGLQGPELYCKLVGANSERNVDYEGNLVIQGQVCDHCDTSRPDKSHPPEYAVDGQETWWQSPPLSRGMKYNEINLTIDLGQEFHVAYVVVKMGNSPRPGVWVLERSADHGQTYQPWQYFADNLADCESFFGKDSIKPISSDDSVTCETAFSKIVPLENGEIFVKLLANRPSANNFFNSFALQEFTRATNVRFRLLRVKNLLGHLMPVARQDPTTTRRYFYSIKDVSIGGRCRCNGHADLCDITDPNDSYKLICRCKHNTCGHNCERCCPGFQQKAWSQSKYDKLFECEPCNCYGHSETCIYDNATDAAHLSIDIHGKYEGGGICQNCRDHTIGINCDKCANGYYRPFGKHLNETDVCQPCDCNHFYSTGNCSEGFGKCECKPAYAAPDCKSCSEGYYDYPECKPCECFPEGTRGKQCENNGGMCPCKQNFGGQFCYQCAEGFYDFPECKPCQCNEVGSKNAICDQKTGQCACLSNYGNQSCDQCNHGYYGFSSCSYCNCDAIGSLPEICNKVNGQCLCKEGYAGPRCDKCSPGYNGYPDCKPCGCSEQGSASSVCDASGKCPCLPSFAGKSCEQCSPGFYQYPDCKHCDCNSQGSIGVSCDNDGKCKCKPNFSGTQCNQCKEGLYNFPICEECNCNPAGVLSTFAGCGSLPLGELCQCKPRVTGRICNECRELYWNLEPTNPEGCQECDCFMPGVLSGVGVCNPKSGQCVCKPSATSRRCDECAEGFYSLDENSLFGCSECDCNIGGSINEKCDKTTGQCLCQPRIIGRACTEPMQAHYFPTLYQFLYEAEDGRTPVFTPVRYGFDEELFPEYSWKGYAVFSQLQSEIVHEINIDKPSIYRIVLRYVSRSNETIVGQVSVTPETPNNINIEQKFMVQLKPSKTPSLVTVSGATNNIPSPFVMNPGRWAITIKIDQGLFVDYFVILPAEYYEGNILVDKVLNPCITDNIEDSLCRHFDYPSITNFDQVRSNSALMSNGDDPIDYFDDLKQLEVLGLPKLPMISETQPELKLELPTNSPGPYVILVNYITPSTVQTKAIVDVEVNDKINSGKVILYACHHTTVCRQAAVDATGKVAIFNINDTNSKILLKGGQDRGRVGIDSIVAVPLKKWSLDYINPNPSCVKKDGKCIHSLYPTPPDTKKVEFKFGNEARLAQSGPKNVNDNSSALVLVDMQDTTVDLAGKIPNPGPYVFIVHFYQPDFPTFEMSALIHNGQTYEAILPIKHCPSNSGCRSVIVQPNGNTEFHLTENFLLTLNGLNHGSVWLEYVLVVPAQEYTEYIIKEQPFDYTGLFISKCGTNNFYMNSSTTGFCKESTFSLTTAYNSGAQPCLCDSDGSLSYICDPFGGQCQCRPNVIGRRCEICKTGYFGFPDCKSCDCPSVATCEATTGECICPPRVTGKNCDQCEPMTYGIDPIIGCAECKCNYFGVEKGNLQCDLFNGSCECKQNVVGRSCDHCRSGHWSFPTCLLCDCDYRGTTNEICNQLTSECYCKANVYGQACDLCKEGTFNIQEKNEEGCSTCFCFGKTSRCQSSNLYRTEITIVDNWLIKTINVSTKSVMVEEMQITPEKISDQEFGVDLTAKELEQKVTYFSSPKEYLGNQLKSYGGYLNFTIQYTSNLFGNAVGGADVILNGHDIYLHYFSLEQPASNTLFPNSVEIVEQSFVLTNGLPATREQIMQVLQDLQAIYIRATYWEPSVTTRISNISWETAQEEYIMSKEIATAIEQCQCPPNYVGLSCEECADGYYRAQSGPYGGFCVPCNCNGHSATCDKITGICDNCKHNTTGEHCEKCITGYHGNATIGTPYDCLICACPLPIPSNNFATGCEVSPDGNKISCDCISGYFGARCESCNAGFYGSPEIPGEVCKECQCSGNIIKEDPASCDSITGRCTRCLNNTFGESCQYCKPGFFGDAISLKDCQACDCDKCGMDKCDNYNGKCVCQPNVEGDKCDACAVNHYGFGSCKGCKPCGCGLASESSQCDENTGMCRCKPGVAGRMCDRCKPGYWNYTSEGCISCGCNSEYSVGISCNPLTGHCECLPGVIGEKCDHCPHRWVLIQPGPNIDTIAGAGCFECDNCTHALLDVTDNLFSKLYPVSKEFETVALGYFTTQRLLHINKTVLNLQPNLTNLVISNTDPFSLDQHLFDFQKEIESSNRKAKTALADALALTSKSDLIHNNAKEIKHSMDQAVVETRSAVTDVTNLAQSLQDGAGPQIDSALNDAQMFMNKINQSLPNTEDKYEETSNALDKAVDLHGKMTQFTTPLKEPLSLLEQLKNKMGTFKNKINDIKNQTDIAREKASQTAYINDYNRESLLKQNDRTSALIKIKDEADSAMGNLTKLAKDALSNLENSRQTFAKLGLENESMKAIKSKVNSALGAEEKKIEELQVGINKAQYHANTLKEQADFMESLIKNSTSASDSVILAANSYKNIATEIQKSFDASMNASSAAENAIEKSEGIGEKVVIADQNSTKLFQDARKSLADVQEGLEESLKSAQDLLLKVNNTKKEVNDRENEIYKQVEHLISTVADINSDKDVKKSLDYDEKSLTVIKDYNELALSLPKNLIASQQLNKDAEHAKKFITQSNNQLDIALSLLPKATSTFDRLKDKPEKLNKKEQQIKTSLDSLQKKIAICREMINRIKVGVSLKRNSTLELRNPENLAQQGISTLASIYFKTDQPNGLILYLGNEVGTSRRMRRAKTDDFMALQVQNGYLVLLMDIGSGISTISSSKRVSDNKWYKATVERTGKTVKLTVHEDLGKDANSETLSYTKETILPGNSSIMNLDKDHSKLFLGGLPFSFQSQPGIVELSLEGRVEELMLGSTHIGLWNFVDSLGVNDGSVERDQLINATNPSGYRMNGEGFIVLNSAPYKMNERSSIVLSIKTTSADGLIFLAFKNNHYMSIEMENGNIVSKLNLGSGPSVITSKEMYNDDKWHSIETTRLGKESVLKVDGEIIASGTCPGDVADLQVSEHLYIGGYPGNHGLEQVTKYNYDGCLDQVQFNEFQVDLSKNVNAFGIIAGCPEKFTSIVSFEPGSRGHVKWPNATASDNVIDLILRFKTSYPDGVLVYGVNGPAIFSLKLENGILVFKSGGVQVSSTQSTRYDDDQWHVVFAAHSPQGLSLLVDDYDSFQSDRSPNPVRFLFSDFYFGGVPSSVDAAAAISQSFIGCIGDATFNGKIINFAQLTEIPGATIGRCSGPPTPGSKLPKRGPVPPIDKYPDTTIAPVPPITFPPTFAPDETTKPTPQNLCTLPIVPRDDPDMTKDSGYRFGNMIGSRFEYDNMILKPKNISSELSVDIKTTSSEGIIFFGQKLESSDMIAVYLSEGKVYYQLSCDSIPATIIAQMPVNDGEWHTVKWSRSNTKAELFVDGTLVGSSNTADCKLDITPPFYLGGTNPLDYQKVIDLVKMNETFEGCLRRFKANSKELGNPDRKFGVSRCSDKVEGGAFFFGNGGYIRLFDKFVVGKELRITMQIKPRSIDGTLMSVKTSKRDHLLLELKNGTITFSVNTGKGPMSASYSPASPYFLCDGQWHTIEAVKSKNVAQIGVDNDFKPPDQFGKGGSVDSVGKQLYIGGHPLQKRNGNYNRYIGCIKNIEIIDSSNEKHNFNKFPTQMVQGNVTLNLCPTI
ncbi:laminin subunit alpha [Daktulosphaira vitifoliae]|uniref:laminin subunit alpha n=1 Tax=Daktulosphaira vitifoliae TaxID=58002 RepID=UPI0021A99468|nr:laminin subunit alpha [Daktulosphaira vitifoliae]